MNTLRTSRSADRQSAGTKRRLSLGTAAAVLLALALTAPAMAAEVTIEASTTASPGGHYIYRMEQPSRNADQLAEKMGGLLATAGHGQASLKDMSRVEDRWAYADDRIQFSINRDGSELYYTDFPGLKLTETTGPLPSDREALKISYEFLQQSGLLPENVDELRVDHVGGIMQALADPTTTYEPEKKAVVVYFYRELDGLRVMNYGSSITVTVGDAAVPVGLQYHWREVASREPVTQEMAVDSRAVPGLIRADLAGVFAADSRIIIDRIDLVLHDNGGQFIQPAYCYQGRCISEQDGAETPVLGYVPALSQPPEAVHHPGMSPDRPAFSGKPQK